MRDGLVVIDTFLNEIDAEVARGRLDSVGIAAEVDTDNCGGMRPHLDLTRGVRLLVDQKDEARAREAMADLASGDSSAPWKCPACGEDVEGNFTTCWNCGREQE